MAGTVDRLSINGAFFLEIKESHVDYQVCLGQLVEICDLNCALSRVVSDCGPLLNRMRDAFSTQCQLEETYGYVRAAEIKLLKVDPSVVQKTFNQHRELSLLLMESNERFNNLQYQGTLERELHSFLQDLRHFQSRIELHENTEYELIRVAMSGGKN